MHKMIRKGWFSWDAMPSCTRFPRVVSICHRHVKCKNPTTLKAPDELRFAQRLGSRDEAVRWANRLRSQVETGVLQP